MGEVWEELTFPRLPLSAKCGRSTFTNVILFHLTTTPWSVIISVLQMRQQKLRWKDSQAGGDLSGQWQRQTCLFPVPSSMWP